MKISMFDRDASAIVAAASVDQVLRVTRKVGYGGSSMADNRRFPRHGRSTFGRGQLRSAAAGSLQVIAAQNHATHKMQKILATDEHVSAFAAAPGATRNATVARRALRGFGRCANHL